MRKIRCTAELLPAATTCQSGSARCSGRTLVGHGEAQ